MKRIVLLTVGICTLACSAFAQPPARRPGPEHARMSYFAGQWQFAGESDGLKYTVAQGCEWFAGGFHLVCRGEGKGELGSLINQAVFAYDPGARSYTIYSINSFGNALFGKGAVADKIWTWDTELNGVKGPFKARLTMTEQSPTAYTYKMEGLVGGSWTVLEEGHANKVR